MRICRWRLLLSVMRVAAVSVVVVAAGGRVVVVVVECVDSRHMECGFGCNRECFDV